MIEEKKLQYWIDHFYGYGSWSAPVWFVSYEDSGGDLPEEVAEKLDYFFNLTPAGNDEILCDIRELYQSATAYLSGPRADKYKTLHDYRFGSHATIHGIWKNLIAFVHGFQNEAVPDLLTYQQEVFASSSKQREAWLQFYPLPSPHNHAWYYSWLNMPQFSYLKNRAIYQQHLYTSRASTLLQHIKKYKPAVVLMYDMNNINVLKESVLSFFPDAKFKSVKGIKLRTPQHHYTNVDGTILLITTQTPALHHNRVETGFDWYDFGKKVNEEK